MQPRSHKYLYDILKAAGHIAQFTHGKTFAEYETDVLLRSGVERQFEIIGEALTQLADVDPAIVSRIAGYQRVVSFRNRLIHGYAFVDNRIVWDILQNRLSILRDQAAAILHEIDPSYDPKRHS